MKKSDLIEFVATRAGCSKKDAKTMVETVFDGIERGLVEDGKVSLSGFGNFVMRERAGRKARNPKTGESVMVPPKRVPIFQPSDILKKVVE